MSDLTYNETFQANNVFEFDIDYDKAFELVQPQLAGLNQLDQLDPQQDHFHLKDLALPLFVKIPKWNGDISWISAASKETFDFFDTCFQTLEIADKTKQVTHTDTPLIMYSGFFVVRSYGTAPHFHHDYLNSGINAFTLMTPIQLDETAKTGHLLYKNTADLECQYKYKKGKAITFGSDFMHSTEPFESKQKFIFLCFTYGSTDLNLWKKIKATAANQGVSYRHPSGDIVVTNPAYEMYF